MGPRAGAVLFSAPLGSRAVRLTLTCFTAASALLDVTGLVHCRFAEEREFGSCCYGFALTFINHMRSLDGRVSLSRDEFTASHVLPRMKTVSLYISIYQAVSRHGFHIAEAPRDM